MPHPSIFGGWDSTPDRHFGIFVWQADLALAFGDDGELHSEGVQDGIDGFEARVGACSGPKYSKVNGSGQECPLYTGLGENALTLRRGCRSCRGPFGKLSAGFLEKREKWRAPGSMEVKIPTLTSQKARR